MHTVLTLPNATLRQESHPIESFDAEVILMFQNLATAMEAGPGGVGIAAPQVGILKRAVVVDCNFSMRPCKHHGRLFMANPQILEHDGEVLGREGCLSVPEWVGTVPRAKHVTVQFQNEKGELNTINTSGFEARVIQHEIDHLDGVLFIDRVVSTQDLIRRM